MHTPPTGFDDTDVREALAAGWDVTAVDVAYLPVGFGSHHWDVTDDAGRRWFVSADVLTGDEGYARLTDALSAAVALHGAGRPAVAPVPPRDGDEPAVRAAEGWAVALYPYVDGRSYSWDDWSDPDLPRAVLDLVLAVHTAPPDARGRARTDDVTRLPDRDAVEAVLAGEIPDTGPYARPTVELLTSHADDLRRRYARYDALAAAVAAKRPRLVLTHGEPHPGNVLLTADGWRLVDWDSALVAPPERDLWDLGAADAYTDATGHVPDPAALALYRLRWDLADLASYVARFRRVHAGDADDDESWRQLDAYVRKGDGQ